MRHFALRFIHSNSGATGVFLPICCVVYLLYICGANLTDASSKIDVRRPKVGDLLLKIFSTLCITMSSIPCSRSVAISVPVTRQRHHLERIQGV